VLLALEEALNVCVSEMVSTMPLKALYCTILIVWSVPFIGASFQSVSGFSSEKFSGISTRFANQFHNDGIKGFLLKQHNNQMLPIFRSCGLFFPSIRQSNYKFVSFPLNMGLSNEENESTIRKEKLSRVGKECNRRRINRSNRKAKATSRVNAFEIQYLETATRSLLNNTVGSLSEMGKWHQVVSLLMAWSKYAKQYPEAPVLMQLLLQRLVEEKRISNPENSNSIEITVDMYNAVIDAWICAAFFQQQSISPQLASQRAREILSSMQDDYEQSVINNDDMYRTISMSPSPNLTSFSLVLHCVCRIEGAFVARRVLAWMEYLTKSGKNVEARPIRNDYIMVLDSYGSLRDKNTPQLTEGFIRHMNAMYSNTYHKLLQPTTTATTVANERFNDDVLLLPDTYCYNILLKSWNKQVFYSDGRGGRVVAEQADRILEEMKGSGLPHCQPDLVTYSCMLGNFYLICQWDTLSLIRPFSCIFVSFSITAVISAWAASGMKTHAVSRAEALLLEIEESPHLEANCIVLNVVMSTWVKSRNPASVARTEEILRQMEDFASPNSAGEQELDINVVAARPDLISYNTHLHALSIHSLKNPKYAQKSEALLQQLEEKFDSGVIGFGPNTFTYNLVLEALCRATQNSKDLDFISLASTKAALILRTVIKRENVDPDVYTFNQVLSILSRTSSPGSAKTAAELLNYMNNTFSSGVHPLAKPNTESYFHVISAFTRNPGKVSAEQAEMLLNQMYHQYLHNNDKSVKPTQACYNTIIDCWAKSGEGTLGARKAEGLLYDMQYQYEVLGDKSMTPTLMTFNAVLNAWAKSGTRCCGYKAEQYLKKMWDMYDAGDSDFKPNDFSYNTVGHLQYQYIRM
jgi:hypothetical protein